MILAKFDWVLFPFLGGLLSAIVGFNDLARAERWGRWWLEPNAITERTGILRLARFLVRRPDFLFLWTYLLPILVFVCTIFYGIYRWDLFPAAAYCVGFLIPRIVTFNYADRSKNKIKLWMLVVIAKKVATYCSLEEAKDLFYEMARDPEMEVRIAAINGFMELDPLVGLVALKKMQNDPDGWPRKAATEAYEALKLAATGNHAQKLQPLANLIVEHKQWKKSISLGGMRVRQFRRNMLLTAYNIDEIVYSQLAQRLAFPKLYCQTCFARAVSAEYEDWSWVHCRVCGEADAMLFGVENVIGQIGGAQGQQFLDGTLVIPVWDEVRKIALAADLDVLQIVGGQEMNYDWAVSAVVLKLQHRVEGNAPKTQLELIENPQLAQNSLMLLKSVVKEVPPI